MRDVFIRNDNRVLYGVGQRAEPGTEDQRRARHEIDLFADHVQRLFNVMCVFFHVHQDHSLSLKSCPGMTPVVHVAQFKVEMQVFLGRGDR